uniref:Uncharacterized protein n=1 Tax=Rhizophora mucronata TaxID=61149 RepID=A0A2P2Q267_RHIMU
MVLLKVFVSKEVERKLCNKKEKPLGVGKYEIYLTEVKLLHTFL